VTADAARTAAREAEIAVMKGEPIGPLHGVPCRGRTCCLRARARLTGGSRLFEEFLPEEDALAVGRLKAAGTVLLARTNTSEFGPQGLHRESALAARRATPGIRA
jgi:aspartyl-tRNA(Asn)/glutamyl-tRNA(Gln) amidotransferase subunit A